MARRVGSDGARTEAAIRDAALRLIARYGADTERLYTLFSGPPDRDAEWNDTAVEGAHRFLNRVWNLALEWPVYASASEAVRTELACDGLPDNVHKLHRKTHQTIRKITADLEAFHFNTAVAATMASASLSAWGSSLPSTRTRASLSILQRASQSRAGTRPSGFILMSSGPSCL